MAKQHTPPARRNSIIDLEFEISVRLRYATAPRLYLHEWSTREDVRAVRHLIPQVEGIGPKRLAVIDAWLKGGA
jgi:hypothetical protein